MIEVQPSEPLDRELYPPCEKYTHGWRIREGEEGTCEKYDGKGYSKPEEDEEIPF